MARLNVFVACPYMLFPLDDYKAVFAAIKKSYDVDFRFADEQITNQHVLAKITTYIRDADISLFDITGWNPNVALELGIAVGLGRRYFILLNHKLDQNKDVPSDIKGIDRVQYSSNSELEAKIMILIRQEMPQSNDRSDSAFETLKIRVSETLTTSPGLSIAKLADAAKEDKSLVQSTVKAMVASGDLKTRGQKKGMIYFNKETDMRSVPRNISK
jgi:hypothetical protein